jgi:hypothetical protein
MRTGSMAWEFIAGHMNYWLFIVLMLTGLYIVIAKGNLLKKIVNIMHNANIASHKKNIIFDNVTQETLTRPFAGASFTFNKVLTSNTGVHRYLDLNNQAK